MQQAHSSGKLCHYLLNSTMNVNSKVKQIFFFVRMNMVHFNVALIARKGMVITFIQ